jgi:hypothetical protein
MRTCDLGRYALCIGIAAGMLAGCGGSQSLIGGLRATALSADSLPYNKTFHFTGKKQLFVVPAGVKWLTVVALGAAGRLKEKGRGGRVFAEILVVGGERLGIFVGGEATSVNGGYNGGGLGGYSGDGQSYGGGGATDIREGGDSLHDRILVAGGGGGEGEYAWRGCGGGGGGGGRIAGTGGVGCFGYPAAGGGTGGTQQHAGSGGSAGGTYSYGDADPGVHGSFGKGGTGGQGGVYASGAAGEGGGGGGGYYGGGGGGGGGSGISGWGDGGGGGGGSSYIEPSARKSESWKGWKTARGNGLLIIAW